MIEPFEELSALQKVSIFLIALGQETTADILRHMSEGEAENIVQAISDLEVVDTETMDRVLGEFEDLLREGRAADLGGPSFARGAVEAALGKERADGLMDRIAKPQPSRLEDYRGVDPKQLLAAIEKEHPQTIALILSRLDPQLAAGVLAGLPQERQADVAYRLATLGAVSPEALQELETSLSEELQALLTGRQTRVDGPRTVAGILNHTTRETEYAVLSGLDRTDPQLAESMRGELFVFEDVARLTDSDIQRLLSEVDGNDLALALKGATDEIRDRIFGNLSKRRVETLKEEIEFLGKVRLSEIQEAQQKISRTTRGMVESGTLTIVRGDGDYVV